MLIFIALPAFTNLVLALSAPTAVATLAAQTPTPSPAFKFPSQLNLQAPQSGALSVLGLSPSTAQTPSNLQNLVGGLVNSFGASGQLQNGFAFSGNLSQYLSSDSNRLYDFRSNGIRSGYQLTRFSTISLAGVRGTGSDTSARVAASLSIPLIDRTDWRCSPKLRTAFADDPTVSGEATTLVEDMMLQPVIPTLTDTAYCVNIKNGVARVANLLNDSNNKSVALISSIAEIKSDLQSITQSLNTYTPHGKLTVDSEVTADPKWQTLLSALTKYDGARIKAVDDMENTYVASFTKKFNAESWNAENLTISGAYSGFTPNASTTGLKGEGSYAWITYARPLTQHGQLTLYGQYASKSPQWNSTTSTWLITNSQTVGGRIKGGTDSFGLFVEYEYSNLSSPMSGKIQHTLQGGVELKLSELGWLQVAIGGGSGGFASKNVLGISLNFNLSPTRGLSPTGSPAS